MKKIIFSAMLLLIMPLQALAETLPLESHLPEDTMFLAKINPANLPENLQIIYKSFLEGFISRTNPNQETTLLNDVFIDNLPPLYLFLDNNTEKELTFAIALKEETYKLMSDEQAAGTDQLAYSQGYLFFNSYAEKTYLEKINCNDCNKVTNNNEYKEVSNNYLKDSFLQLYSPNLTELLATVLEEENPFETIFGAFGFSTFIGDEKISTKQTLKNDLLPAPKIGLHKKLSDLPTVILINRSGFNDIKDYLKSLLPEIGADMEQYDFLFDREMLLAVQNQNKMIPAITFLMDSKNNLEEIKEMFTASFNDDWEMIKKNALTYTNLNGTEKVNMVDSSFVTTIIRKTVNIEDTPFDRLEVSMKPVQSPNPYAKSGIIDFTITFGFTDDGILLISSDEEIETNYGKGPKESEISTEALKDSSGAFYINSQNLSDYLSHALYYFSSPLQNSQNVELYIKQILENAGNYLQTENQGENLSTSEINWSINLNEFIKDLETLDTKSFFQEMKKLYSIETNLSTNLSKISQEEWYAESYYFLTTTGVNDVVLNDFTPSGEITRDQYIHMIMNLLEYMDKMPEVYNYKIPQFPDVEQGYYYWDIYKALQLGLVKGDANGNFNPKQSLNRAEAAEIMKRVLNLLNTKHENQEEMNFQDVQVGDWFYEGIKTVYQNKVMRGTGNLFNPGGFVNQAELMKITKNLHEFIKYQ